MNNIALTLLTFTLLLNPGCHRGMMPSSQTPNDTVLGNQDLRKSNDLRPDVDILVPGVRVGPLKLQIDADVAYEILGKSTEDYDYSSMGGGLCGQRETQWLKYGTHGRHTYISCPDKSIHWLALELQDTEIRGYFLNNSLYQISVSSTLFTTEGGIGKNESPQSVKERFPEMEAFTIPKSASKFTGERDQVFWVDQAKGIAFELYYLKKNLGRRVGRIYIFSPDKVFSPTGCSMKPESWVKLKPFALENK